jgi:translation elongation factor EF-Ts
MGFSDFDANKKALVNSKGDFDVAIDYLQNVKPQGGGSTPGQQSIG